jgi:hypothetical protein
MIEYSYEYIRIQKDQSRQWNFGGIRLYENDDPMKRMDFLNKVCEGGYKLIGNIEQNMLQGFILAERAVRIDNEQIEARFNARLESLSQNFNERLNNIAEEKARIATDALRITLLEAVKDAKLFDETYKNALLESTLNTFRIELREAIEQIKADNGLH